MTTPFDEAIAEIRRQRYHNHRLEDHSDIVSNGVYADLLKTCERLREDAERGVIRRWLNVGAPGPRERRIDLFVGEPAADGSRPDLPSVRICIENKSVITAHRNRDARFDDLNETMQVIHRVKPEAVVVATVLVGVAQKVLNVPDQVKKFYKDKPGVFDASVLPRLSSGDATLWDEFGWAVSRNKLSDPRLTVEKFRKLQTRRPGHTHVMGYDYVLLVPVHIDNVGEARVARENDLGIDIDRDYQEMLRVVCTAYTSRWHT